MPEDQKAQVAQWTPAAEPAVPQDPPNALYNLAALRPIARWCRTTLGEAELQRICEEADVLPHWFQENSHWVSLRQFEAVLSAGRARVASDEEFTAISAFEYAPSYRYVRFMTWALTPSFMYRAEGRAGGYFSTAGRFTVVAMTRNKARVRWTSSCRESRLMCLWRQGSRRQLPTLWGMPAAHVREYTCIARGDHCCEYEFYWLRRQRWLPLLVGAVAGLLVDWVLAYVVDAPRLVASVIPLIGAVAGYVYESRQVERGNTATQTEIANSFRDLAADAAEASRRASELEARLRAAERAAGRVDAFIGRDREVATLGLALQDASVSRGRLILVSGEAGIGKTRLVDEFVASAHSRGARALVGRCHEGEGAPALWPWMQILRSALRDESSARLAVDSGLLAEVAQLVPEMSQGASSENAPSLEPSHARFRLFDAVARLLKRLSTRSLLVIAIDDLQWADRPTLLLLQFLVSQSHDAHLLVIGAYRDPDLGPGDALTQVLPDLMREPGCEPVSLSGLAREQLAPFIAGITGAQVADTLVTAVYDITEGNPFFTREVVRLLASEGTLQTAGSPGAPRIRLPQTVREVVRRRLGRLSGDCNRVLEVGAVIGREFVLDRIASLAAFDRARLLEVTEEALAARVIRAAAAGPLVYSFAHAVVREVLYDAIPSNRRAEMHGQIGEVLEHSVGSDPTATLAELAHHYSEAAREGGSVDKAVTFMRRAGDAAMRLAGYEDAARSYQRALNLLRIHQLPEEQVHCELLLALGEAQLRTGDAAGARERSLQAAELARHLGLHEHFARAALGFGWWFRMGVVDTECIALLAEALGRLEDDDSALRSRLMARLAAMLYWIPGSYERRDTLSAEAVAMARRLQDPGALAFALNARLYALWVLGDAERRLPVSRELLQMAESARDRELAQQSRQWVVTDLLELGHVELAEREIAAYTSLAEEMAQPLSLWFASRWRAMRALLHGELDRVEALAAAALEIGLRAEPENAEGLYSELMVYLRKEEGRIGELLEPIRAYASLYPHLSRTIGCALAMIYAELDRKQDAEREFQAVAAYGFENIQREQPITWHASLAAAAEASCYLNDPHAADLYELLLPFARRNIVVFMASSCLGSGSRYLGLLATMLRRWGDAEHHFNDALAMHAELRSPPLSARTQHDYARMLIARDAPGDRARAGELLAAAVATARGLGMRSLLEKGLALQAAITADSPPRVVDPVTVEECQFRCDGDYWTVSFAGTTCRLKDSRGLQYLAQVLWHPGREFHATELIADTRGRTADSPPFPNGGEATERIAHDLGDAGPLLDQHATRQYQQRLAELRDELMEAEALNDLGRTAKVRDEIAALTTQLAGAARGRRANSHAERARMTATKGIKAAIEKISGAHPQLGRHLTATVRTGYFCSYTPDPRHPINWQQ